MNFFVKPDDTIAIKIYAHQNGDQFEFFDEPKTSDDEPLSFSFRRPNYQDSTAILSVAQTFVNGEMQLNSVILADQVVRQLLVGWSLKDDNGDPIACKYSNVAQANPELMRMVAQKILNVIKI